MIGSLEKFSFYFVKTRVSPGIWLNEKSRLELAGRKLFSSMRFRVVEENKDFKIWDDPVKPADLKDH